LWERARFEKMSCLIIVERGVTEKNNITSDTIKSGIKSFFRSLKSRLSAKNYSYQLNIRKKRGGVQKSILVYGVSHEISLTSVLLGTLLDKEGIVFSVVDANDVLEGYRDFIRKAINEVSLVAVSTTYTMRMDTIKNILAFIRKQARRSNPNIKIIIGGPSLHAWLNNDFIGKEMFEHLKLADYLFFGEADTTFGDVAKRIISGKKMDGIEGLVYKNGDGFAGSQKRVMVKTDEIASPDWGIVKKYNFNDLRGKCSPESAGIEEGRGCIFRCSFCSYSSEVIFRRKDPDIIIRELKNVHGMEIRKVSFLGAEFFYPERFSEPVLRKIGQLKFPLDIWTFGRIGLVAENPNFVELLHNANVTTIQFGLESGSPRILKAMNKKINLKKVVKASKLLRDHDINVKASIIIGFPGETKETLITTKEVLKESNFSEIMIHGLVVLPGTPLYNNRENFGIKMTPMGWAHETMGVADLPHHIQDMIVFLTKHTDTFILNIGQNIAPKFFKSSPGETQVRQATKVLQKMLCKQWDDVGTERLSLLKELLEVVDIIPEEYIS